MECDRRFASAAARRGRLSPARRPRWITARARPQEYNIDTALGSNRRPPVSSSLHAVVLRQREAVATRLPVSRQQSGRASDLA